MSLIKLKYEVLISGIYPFTGYYEKNGFKIIRHQLDNDLVNKLYSSSAIYFSPYIGICCYPDDSGNPLYLTFEKEIEIEIEYTDIEEYNLNFTNEHLKGLNLFDEIDMLEKLMVLEINNNIQFPVKIIRAFTKNDKLLTVLGDIKSINLPSLISTNENETLETIKRQNNRLSSGFSYESINELKNNNIFFNNSLSMYFSSFSTNDDNICFILLTTSLEALLSLSTYEKPERCSVCGQPRYKIRATVSKNVSLLLLAQDEIIEKTMKNFYDMRSNFVHNGNRVIAKQDVQYLQEIVRKVLLVYWNISLKANTYNHKEIISIIMSDEYKNDTLNKIFLSVLENITFKEKKFKALEEILNGITNGTVGIKTDL